MNTTILAPQKVLVIDDQPLWQLMIAKALKRMNAQMDISFSETAEDAYGMLKSESKFDLIIADQMLEGGKSGLDLWDDLLRTHDETPYVLISGLDKNEFIEELMQYRIERIPQFIEKPASVMELSEKLKDVVLSHTSQKAGPLSSRPATLKRNGLLGLALLASAVLGTKVCTQVKPEVDVTQVHPEYALYLEDLDHGKIPTKIAKTFPKKTILLMNQVAMDRSFAHAIKEKGH